MCKEGLNMKLPVGNDFKDMFDTFVSELPKDELVMSYETISGYYMVVTNKHVYFVGARVFNVTEAPIMLCSILPVYKDCPVFKEENENTVDKVFNLENEETYYIVEMGEQNSKEGFSYIFNNLSTALYFIGIYVNVKSCSFHSKE